jgi:hypothetical protein
VREFVVMEQSVINLLTSVKTTKHINKALRDEKEKKRRGRTIEVVSFVLFLSYFCYGNPFFL